MTCQICNEREATSIYWQRSGRQRIMHRCDECRLATKAKGDAARRAKMEAHGLWRPKVAE